MLSRRDNEIPVDQKFDGKVCTRCGSRNIDPEHAKRGERPRCNVCGLRGRYPEVFRP